MSPERAGELMDELGWPRPDEEFDWNGKIIYGSTPYDSTRDLVEARVFEYAIVSGIDAGEMRFSSHIASGHFHRKDHRVAPRWALSLADRDGLTVSEPGEDFMS